MDFFKDRILPLIEKSGLNDVQIEKALNLPRSTIYDWKHGRSKSYKKNISDIASLFHVSTDYLLGNTDIKAPTKDYISYLPESKVNIYTDRILPLLQSSGRTDRDLEAEMGLPRGILYKWKKG